MSLRRSGKVACGVMRVSYSIPHAGDEGAVGENGRVRTGEHGEALTKSEEMVQSMCSTMSL